jgi:hypothetical protein
MRAGLAGAVLYAATAAHAGTLWTSQLRNGNAQPPSIARPLDFSTHAPLARYNRADVPLLGPERAPPSSAGFSIGPLRAEGFTNEIGKGGRVRFRPHYRLEGVSVLGGSIGGSLDTRGGMLTLNWKTTR